MYAVEELAKKPGFLDALSRSIALEADPPLLRDLKIKLTSLCNLRCAMCGYWENKTETALPTERWKAVLSEASALGARKVHFSGGEVFLRKDFLDLVEHASGIGLKVNLTTNGTLVDGERVRRLLRAGVNAVSISLDGPDAAVHNAVRRRDYAFKSAVRTARRLAAGTGKRRVKVRINSVVMRDNFRELPRMVELAARLGAIDLVPMPVDEKGEGTLRLTKRHILEYNREVAPRVEEARLKAGWTAPFDRVYPFGVTEEEVRHSKKGLYARGYFETRTCLAPWLHMFVAWDGAVYLCCMTNGRIEPLGNVGTMPVSDVFLGERYRAVRADFTRGRQLKACASCDLFRPQLDALHSALEARARAPKPAAPRP
ncbi:MAG: radical SAM protein [Elusimicrobia bacterium]|nr:radical SAM protein [Elusimicrobiota bacterium]